MRYLRFLITLCVVGMPMLAALPQTAASKIAVVAQPSQSPVVTLRVLFLTGAAYDPPGKEGLAALTAAMVTQSGTEKLTSAQVTAELFPTASGIGAAVDKEMSVISGSAHRETLDRYYAVLRDMLLAPGFRPEDFKRLRDANLNFLKTTLRESDDEELGKEHLYNVIYGGTPYAHHDRGTVSSVEKLTLDDVKDFYRRNYTQANLVVGVAGGYPASFIQRLETDFAKLPAGTPTPRPFEPPKLAAGTRIEIVKRETDATGISFGFPIGLIRGSKDFPAIAVAASYLGQHRSANGRLFNRLREIRGLNYGDYAYVEHYPNGGGSLIPPANVARQQQIFQIWVRPVEPVNGLFALRTAMYEYDKFVRDGLSKEDFEATVSFLSKYTGVLTQTQSLLLGYALDSRFYKIPDYSSYMKTELAKLKVEDVNRAIKRYLQSDATRVVIVTKDAEGLRKAILEGLPSPITYNSPKSKDVLDEDKVIQSYRINVKPADVVVRPVAELFQ